MVTMGTDQVHVYHLKTYRASLATTVIVMGATVRMGENYNVLGLEKCQRLEIYLKFQFERM